MFLVYRLQLRYHDLNNEAKLPTQPKSRNPVAELDSFDEKPQTSSNRGPQNHENIGILQKRA